MPLTAPPKPAPLPPLPVETSGRWLHVTADDDTMVERFLRVMYQMDNRYRRDTVEKFHGWVADRTDTYGGAYYYWLADAEVVVRLNYVWRRRAFEVLSVGFVGNLTPAQALDLMIDKIVVFLGGHLATSAFARRPKQMKDPRIVQLHDLVPQSPRLRVTVEKDVPLATRWHIEFLELVRK